MQYLILYAFLATLCFFGVKINDSKSEKVLTIQANANLLRGVFAIFIIYTHCTLAFENLPIVLIPLRKVSTFGVGYFFILSGYGLAYSFGKKENYLKGFLSGKLTKIAVPALVSCIISLVAEYSFLSYDLTILKIFTSMNWYIYSLIVLYIIFYLVYKFMPSRFGRVIGMWALVIGFTFLVLYYVNFINNIGRSYYISQWAFPLGITIYEYHNEIDDVLKKHFVLINFGMLILLTVSFVIALSANEYTALDLIFHNVMLLPFYYVIMVACKYFTFDNALMRFLNKISFEIYLYQFMVLEILKSVLPEINVLYFILTVVITVLIAFVVKGIGQKITGK